VTATLATPLDWTGGPALAWVLAAATLYLLGGRGRRPPRAADRWRGAAFAGGLLTILAALDSPLDELADELFWVHMAQHVLLIGVAPPLLALARPWARMWRGVPARWRAPVSRRLAAPSGWSGPRRLAAILGGGLVSWLIFNLNFVAWHLPVLYDAALRSGAVHACEHLAFFATALLLWTRVIHSPPWRSRLGEPAKLAYLGGTLVVGWVLAIVLATAPAPLYSAYVAEASRPGHISALTDQQFAAGVMWVPGSLPYTIAIVLIAYRLLEPRQKRGRSGPAKPLPTGVG
jgi:cytochrome c oxidase assembly factor CtaG